MAPITLLTVGLLASSAGTAPQPERELVGQISQPEAEEVPSTPSASDPEDAYERLLKFKRLRLEVRPVIRAYAPSPFTFGAWGPSGFRDPSVNVGLAGGVPVSTAPNDWIVIQGAAQVIDELALANLVGDQLLRDSIIRKRDSQRLWWGVGFGSAAAVGLGTGIWLSQSDARDTRTIGISLITLGAVSAVVALLFPYVGHGHVLSATDAQTYSDIYNERLRRELALSPGEITRP